MFISRIIREYSLSWVRNSFTSVHPCGELLITCSFLNTLFRSGRHVKPQRLHILYAVRYDRDWKILKSITYLSTGPRFSGNVSPVSRPTSFKACCKMCKMHGECQQLNQPVTLRSGRLPGGSVSLWMWSRTVVMKRAPVVLNQAFGIKPRLTQTQATWKSQLSSVKVANHTDELQRWLSADCSKHQRRDKSSCGSSDGH